MNDELYLYWFSFINGERYGAPEVVWAQSYEEARRIIENDYLLYNLGTKALYEKNELELRIIRIEFDNDDIQCHLCQER